MSPTQIISELERNAKVFQALLEGVSQEQYIWRQSVEKWCLLEVICHLYDEEREDFRARTNHALHTPTEVMPSITPQDWVKERDYMGQDYNQKLEAFLEERGKSIEWLRAVKNPDWQSSYNHPKMGPLPALLFLTNWLAHDYLHFRQITKLKYDYLVANADVKMDYAGNW